MQAPVTSEKGARLAGARRRSKLAQRLVLAGSAVGFAALVPVVRAAHPGAQARSSVGLVAAPVRTVTVYQQAAARAVSLQSGQLAAVPVAQAPLVQASAPVATAVS
jgi:hypothetical protein